MKKCGTEFGGVVSISKGDSKEKLIKMRTYDLVLDAHAVSWGYLHEDGERAANITLKQDQLCQEFSDLVKDILDTVSDNERAFVEKEVYTYVLQMGIKMCKESEKLFANHAGFQELFDAGDNLVRMGQLDAGIFLKQMMDQDYIYKAVAGLQGLHSSRIKNVLDEDVIYHNTDYRDMTKQLAQAFNDMWFQCVKRYTDFFLSPGEENVNQNWDIYCILLKGLTISDIDTLDERGWQRALDDWEKNHNGWQYKHNFMMKRDQQRDVLRKKEREMKDKQYWESYPDELKRLEENKKKIAELQANIDAIDEEIRAMENDKNPLDMRKGDLETSISDKQQMIEKLEKKIFGKKKAAEEIQTLHEEIQKLNQGLQSLIEHIKTAEEPISGRKLEKKNLQSEITRLEQENVELRNR